MATATSSADSARRLDPLPSTVMLGEPQICGLVTGILRLGAAA